MSISAMILGEFEVEAKSTRGVLEAVPQEHWDWQPHSKSMTLGQLAGHTAEMFGWADVMLAKDVFDVSEETPAKPATVAELLASFDAGLDSFRKAFGNADESTFGDKWSLTSGDDVLFSAPRLAAIRAFVLNHTYHHRAQLGVYLRLLDVPVPSVYGPTADDKSF